MAIGNRSEGKNASGLLEEAHSIFARAGPRLRVLFVAAAPIGADDPIDAEYEWEQLVAAAHAGRWPIALVRVLPPTPEHLIRTVRECAEHGVPPQVLHVAVHGEPLYLLLEDELGREARLAREDLACALRGLGIRLAILNACHSASRRTVSIARYLVDVGAVEAAIGHEIAIPDSVAASLAMALYANLLSGRTVLEALLEADAVAAAEDPDPDRADRGARLFGAEGLELHPDSVVGSLFAASSASLVALSPTRRFSGCAQDLVALGQLLAEPARSAVVLAGVGGVGKTALAAELARRHVWRFAGRVVAIAASGRSGAAELISTTELALGKGTGAGLPALVIYDGLDALSDGELRRLLRFVQPFMEMGSKIILTLRRPFADVEQYPWLAVYVLAHGLSTGAGAALFRRACSTEALPAGTRESLPSAVASLLGGHPALIVTAAEVVVGAPSPSVAGTVQERAALLADQALDAMEEALFAPTWALLDDDGRWLLAVSTLFAEGVFFRDEIITAASWILASPVVLASLESVTPPLELAGQRVAAGIATCIAAGLIALEPRTGVHRVHPAVLAWTRRRRILDAPALGHGLSGVLGTMIAAAKRRDYSVLEGRIPYALSVMETAWSAAPPSSPLRECIAEGVDALAPLLFQRGALKELAVWMSRILGDQATAATTTSRRLYIAGVVAAQLGRFDAANAAVTEALRFDTERGDHRGRGACLHQLAVIARERGDFAAARTLVDQALAAYDEVGDRTRRIAPLQLSAVLDRAQGAVDRADAQIAEALRILDELDDPKRRSACLHERGVIAYERGDWEGAERWLREALTIDTALGDAKGRAAGLQSLAHVAHARGRSIDARAFLREVLRIRAASGDRAGLAVALITLANVEAAQGEPVEAIGLLRVAASTFAEIGDVRNLAATTHELAILEHARGALGEARRLLRASGDLFAELGYARGQVASLHESARLEQTAGNLDSAAALARAARQLSSSLGDRASEANTAFLLGAIESTRKNTGEARTLLEEALRIKRQLGDRQGEAATLGELAALACTSGDLAGARELLFAALSLSEELGDLQTQAGTLHQLSLVEIDLGNLEEASQLAQRARELLVETDDRQGLAASLRQSARIAQTAGEVGRARVLLEEALRLQEAVEDNRGRAASLHDLALLKHASGDHARALSLLGEALALWDTCGDRAGRAAAVHLLGVFAHARGDHVTARQRLLESIELHRSIGDCKGEATSQIALGQLDVVEGRWTEGVDTVRRGLAALEAISTEAARPARALLEKLERKRRQERIPRE